MEKKLAIFSLLLLIPFSCSVFSITNAEDEANLLLSFKASIRDPLRHLSTWIESTNFCNWYGISCLNDSHVLHVELPAKNITGKLSSSLFLLPFLETINLSGNVLVSDLPKELFSCLSLRYLNLSNNNFTGSIPYGSISGLQTLDLSNNLLTGGIPPEIGLFNDLKVLDLGGNVLIGEIPNAIANLQSLEFLTLAGNQLIGEIPPELGQLNNLSWMYLGYNNLSGQIPQELGNLISLKHLDLVYNNLSGEIPASLGNLVNLEYFFVYQNRLTGSLSRSLFNLQNLFSLDLSDNYLSGEIPELVVQLKKLEVLHLFSNNFTGKVPRGVAFLTRLQVLQLWSNQLSGEIPQNLGRHNNLTILDLSSNNLTGKIPEELCTSRRLYKLILFSNYLEGEIPQGLSYCRSLQRIRIQDNRLSGGISPQFTKLPAVYYLDVSGNQLSGRIDHQKWDMPLLEMLNLARNNFMGRMPEFMRASKLERLDLSENRFSGNIPASYGYLQEIMQLRLERNQLSSSIPKELSFCKKLVHLDLSRNLLTGEIPLGFSEMPVLGQLDLSDNLLSGEIPSSLGQSESLVQVNISHNNFYGSLPSTVAFLTINASSVEGNHLCGGDHVSRLPPCKASGRKRASWFCTISLLLAIVMLVSSILLTVFIQKRNKSWSRKVDSDEHGVWDLQFFDSKASKAITMENIVSSMVEDSIISRGKNGTVYKGAGLNELFFVVKDLVESCSLSLSFWEEVRAQAKVHHPNIVKLIGICRSDKNGLLLYEFIDGNSLRNLVSEMSWERRSKIVIGIAKALRLLHFQTSPRVSITTFSLEKIIVDRKDEPHMLLDLPASEAKGMKETTEKGDMYAFGVFLIEILSGKGPSNEELGVLDNVVDWARYCYSDCHLDTWIDVKLKSQSSRYYNEMVQMMSVAIQCTAADPTERPCSKIALRTLESVLGSRSCTSLLTR